MIYNPDEVEYLGNSGNILSYNLYSYCENNPVNSFDYNGNLVLTVTTITAICTIGIIFYTVTLIKNIIEYINYDDSIAKFDSNYLEENWKNLILSIETIILSMLNKLKTVTNDNSIQKHHIVAKADWRASFSRKILSEVGIDINSSINIAYVKNKYHRVLHTKYYYIVLNSFIYTGYYYGGKKGVESVLIAYKTALERL